MAAALTGKIAYHAGASNAALVLAKGEKILAIRALGAGGATLTIFGGDSIPLPAGFVFEDRNDSRAAEWVGDGTSALVFTSTLSYFVKTLKPFTVIP